MGNVININCILKFHLGSKAKDLEEACSFKEASRQEAQNQILRFKSLSVVISMINFGYVMFIIC